MQNTEELKVVLEKFCEGLTQKDLNKISLYKSKKVVKKFIKKYKKNETEANKFAPTDFC